MFPGQFWGLTEAERRGRMSRQRKRKTVIMGCFFFLQGLWVVVLHLPGTISAGIKFPELSPVL